MPAGLRRGAAPWSSNDAAQALGRIDRATGDGLPEDRERRVAVVGGGIAGLAASWFLARRFQVTLYDRAERPGMGAHRAIVHHDGTDHEVDVPLRVLTRNYYPTTCALYARAGIETQRVDYASAFTHLGDPAADRVAGETYFRYRNHILPGGYAVPMLAGWGSLGRVGRGIALDLVRYLWRSRAHLEGGQMRGRTLLEFLTHAGYSKPFIHDLILPAYAGICTCSIEAVGRYPAEILVHYLARGVGLGGTRRPTHGVSDVLARLTAQVHRFRGGKGVRSVREFEDHVVVEEIGGHVARFEHVVIATPANLVGRIVPELPEDWRACFSRVRYETSRLVVHRDTRLIAPHQRDWATVNFVVPNRHDRPMATIWLNRAQPRLRGAPHVFETWNPVVEPNPSTVLYDVSVGRPVVDHGSAEAMERLQALVSERPSKRVGFCGSYAARGVPLLESAVRSAAREATRVQQVVAHR